MEESVVDPSSVPVGPFPAPPRGRAIWARVGACLAVVLLLGFIGQAGRTLWAEWDSLRQDQVRERASAIVGYVNINPNLSYASCPADWAHDEGDDSLLWAGWKDGQHRWFRVGRGDLDPEQLSRPIGRDAIQAIDDPVYERDGGATWGRVPAEAPVVGFEHDGLAVAYPMKVLHKVLIVNDRVGDRPVLVVCTRGGTVSVYEAAFDARRMTLGHGGYFLRGEYPLLYDRGTESLWSEGPGGLVAVAGRRKGASLKLVAKPEVVAWADWRQGHPTGRLLVGADRSRPLPTE